ncbi:helix-turn-helix domain-containing protein [Kribbella turkmenica]|uniref:helix-turn-helix domain-containing protein n=1 Tax=Kribbella turkmenica TaxID=2530375 RepID=UPI0014047A6F|nr:helix-turn-helix domain-containing protein [Kribbella turkmenica]
MPRERFDYWRTWYSEAAIATMRLDPIDRIPADFRSLGEVLACGDTSIIELHCGPAVGSWRPEATEASDLLRVAMFVRGRGVTGHWHGQDMSLTDGSPVLYGRTGGYWRNPAGFRTIQINVPRTSVELPDRAIDRVTARQQLERSPVFQSLVRPVLIGMLGRLEDLSHTATANLDTISVSLITMLVHSLHGISTDGTEHAAARRLQVWRFIEANLADRRLGPDEIAAALHMSRRALYQLLSDEGEGVATTIRRRRLQRARTLLRDPRHRHRSIAEIGADVGLPSPAHFSRLFHAEFGQTPREARRTDEHAF